MDRYGQGTIEANYTSASTAALCHATNGAANNENITDCSGTPVDLAEMYTTSGDLEPGDIAVAAPSGNNLLIKSDTPYAGKVLGVISTNPADVMGNETISKDPDNKNFTVELAEVGIDDIIFDWWIVDSRLAN